jgi:adenylate cyclase
MDGILSLYENQAGYFQLASHDEHILDRDIGLLWRLASVALQERDMDKPSNNSEMWRAMLTGEVSYIHRAWRIYHRLPASPRCKVCGAPFAGPGGFVMRFTGRRPSRMSPRMCGLCERFAETHPGGAEIPLSLLFADIRGSTALAETLGTLQFTRLIARFYDAVTEELIKSDGLVDRLIGDEVIGLFIPALAGQTHAEAAVQAAQGILRATGHENSEGPWVSVGAGVHTGNAFVGAVGSSGVHDITALGDDVNLTARLASLAAAGEILITEAACAAAGVETDGLETRHLEVKGRKEPLDVWVMRVGEAVAV